MCWWHRSAVRGRPGYIQPHSDTGSCLPHWSLFHSGFLWQELLDSHKNCFVVLRRDKEKMPKSDVVKGQLMSAVLFLMHCWFLLVRTSQLESCKACIHQKIMKTMNKKWICTRNRKATSYCNKKRYLSIKKKEDDVSRM